MTDTTINGVNVPFVPIGGVNGLPNNKTIEIPNERSFENIFQKELNKLKFSKHAKERLESRQIELSSIDFLKLEAAVDKAELKGAQESLVILRDMAFIVSVKNRTIITTIDNESLKQNVFTNIDSAVIAS